MKIIKIISPSVVSEGIYCTGYMRISKVYRRPEDNDTLTRQRLIFGCLINNLVIKVTSKEEYRKQIKIMTLPHVYFDIKAESFGIFSGCLGGSTTGRIVIELRSDVVPITAENFRGK